jgi:hypothetical protein
MSSFPNVSKFYHICAALGLNALLDGLQLRLMDREKHMARDGVALNHSTISADLHLEHLGGLAPVISRHFNDELGQTVGQGGNFLSELAAEKSRNLQQPQHISRYEARRAPAAILPLAIASWALLLIVVGALHV